MGELIERSKLSKLVWSDYYENSDYFAYKYTKSDEEVTSVALSSIGLGGFYFFHYNDNSNWMRYSPVFTAGVKKIGNKIILFAVNFNFIPIEVRIELFDKFMSEDTFNKDIPLSVDLKGVYSELLRIGFEYALVEYNLEQILLAHKINMNIVPKFLYSGHPKNKYDPRKQYEIQMAKSGERAKRHEEMSKLMVSDLVDISGEISDEFKVLRGHIQRVQSSIKNYGT